MKPAPLLTLRDLGAGHAEAIQHDLVPFKAETTRGELHQVCGTAVNFEDAVTVAATEMMVVPLARHLIA